MFKVNKSTNEIFLYDDIGPAWAGMIDDGMLIQGLEDIGDQRATLRINSIGGDVFIMASMFNAIRRHEPGVDVIIDGVAASAASYIAMAGDTVTIAENGLMMLHYAWTVAAGNARELRKLADDLDVIGSAMVRDYVAKSGKLAGEIDQILSDETWYNAESAVENRFADSIGNIVIPDSDIASDRAAAKAEQAIKAQRDRTSQSLYKTAAAKIRAKVAKVKA